jgi:hypothetical protein
VALVEIITQVQVLEVTMSAKNQPTSTEKTSINQPSSKPVTEIGDLAGIVGSMGD